MFVYFIGKNGFFFSKTVFCGRVGNDLFMGLWLIEVRSCTSGSPHTPRKRELFGSCCCCYVFVSFETTRRNLDGITNLNRKISAYEKTISEPIYTNELNMAMNISHEVINTNAQSTYIQIYVSDMTSVNCVLM